MSQPKFELSGAVAEPMTVEQLRASGFEVMHQRIGARDPIVRAVPPKGTEDILNSDSVAQGNFMSFYPQGWEQGKIYVTGAALTNGIFTMVSNKLTLDNPFPTPADNPTDFNGAFVPTTQSDTSIVYSGHLFTFTEDVLVKELEVWVTQITPDTSYRIVTILSVAGSDPVTSGFEAPVLTVGAFKTVALLNQLVPAGATLLIYIDALNSGSDTQVTGGWNYTGQDNISPPPQAGWNHDNARTLLRIDKTDLDATDRGTELLGITASTNVQFVNTDAPAQFTTFRTTGAPTDAGTYVAYPVVVIEEGEGGVPIGVTTMTATIPVPLPTEYAEELAGLVNPAWGTITPFLQFDGVDQSPAADTVFGINLTCDITTFSEDWDVFSFNG